MDCNTSATIFRSAVLTLVGLLSIRETKDDDLAGA